MIMKTRMKINGVSYITVKNVKSPFEKKISHLPYSDLIELRDRVSSKQRSQINVELYHRYNNQHKQCS